ncbi:hypothetical protein AA0242T_0824 [Acetobacter aceti NRIC 0242]|uniref:Transposase n=1 Tax=Acetobacter aceti NBRC 14818 TaxID=887700 RepID=A0AB33IBX1_ACEAC|nr:hypothetical protein [Acetobacter aceti]BCK74528.1 hypothetical protein EMQ_0134 [Acetobacter aceti NBRC 14818]GAN56037.1 hypothetical protein Abac_002_186 [Acetobacter aceti NBRC 14818]GBO80122.1 hypothetical protein AA0242T_0824 [Acetobacter aceti NRIC 0242]
MVLATDIDVKGTDGVWRPMTVLTALSMKPDDRKARSFRCRECKGHVRLHGPSKSGTMQAHAEHATGRVALAATVTMNTAYVRIPTPLSKNEASY